MGHPPLIDSINISTLISKFLPPNPFCKSDDSNNERNEAAKSSQHAEQPPGDSQHAVLGDIDNSGRN